MIWPTVKNFGLSPTRAGLVTLSAPEAARNPNHVERGVAWLAARRCEVTWSAHARSDQGYLAAAPHAVADDLNTLLQDPDIDLIVTTGGGTNANAILPFVDGAWLRANPKPVIGLSNTTIVLNHLASASGVVTFHGPVLVWNLGAEEPPDGYTETHLLAALRGDAPLRIEAEASWRWLRPGTGAGRAWGGNLWSFQQLVGTPRLPAMDSAVLFIEECFTELHNIAAALEHFGQAGVLDRLAGLVVGVPTECVETESPDGRGFEEVVADACRGYDFPILVGVNLGHTDRKITVPVGSVASLDSERNTLVFEAPR